MNLKQRDWLFIYLAAALGGVWFVSKVIVGPFHDKLIGLSKNVTVQEARLRRGLSLIEKKTVLSDEYGKFASYFSLQGSSNEEAVADLLKEIEKISRDSGFVILDMKPQRDVASDKVSKQFEISIKADASLREITTFLYGLYNSPLLFSVEKMVLVPKSEESSDLSVSLTVVGVSFL